MKTPGEASLPLDVKNIPEGEWNDVAAGNYLRRDDHLTELCIVEVFTLRLHGKGVSELVLLGPQIMMDLWKSKI